MFEFSIDDRMHECDRHTDGRGDRQTDHTAITSVAIDGISDAYRYVLQSQKPCEFHSKSPRLKNRKWNVLHGPRQAETDGLIAVTGA